MGALLLDAIAAARAQVATTITLVLVLAAVCFAILVTTGQAAATEARVVEQIDRAGTRLIALSDDGGAAGILPHAPMTLESISDVTWTFGLGAAFEVTNPLLPADRVAARALVGTLPPDLPIIQGRAPRPGEAVAGTGAVIPLNSARRSAPYAAPTSGTKPSEWSECSRPPGHYMGWRTPSWSLPIPTMALRRCGSCMSWPTMSRSSNASKTCSALRPPRDKLPL